MSSDRSLHFSAVWLLMGVGERYKQVDSVLRAAEILAYEWPSNVGTARSVALKACLNALQNNGPVDAVPQALMRAADEAFISYIRVIAGGKRSQGRKTGMSRAQHASPRAAAFRCLPY